MKLNTQNRHLEAFVLAILMFSVMGLTGLAYTSGVNDLFLLDDASNILPTVIKEPSWSAFITATLSNDSGVLKRPVSAASFAITSMLHNSVSSYKYHNIIIHVSCGFLIFLFIYKLASFENRHNKQNQYHRMFIACAVSTIWLTHPLHVSTVLYSVQRMTQLATFFSLLTLIFYLQGRSAKHNTQKYFYYFLALPVTTLAALLSKESGALVVCFFALIHIFLSRKHLFLSQVDRLFIYLGGTIPIVAGTVLFTLNSHRFLDYSSRDFSLEQRSLTQVDVVFSYIQNLLLPRLSNMGLYLDNIEIHSNWSLVLGLKFIALTSLIIYGLKKLLQGQLIGLGVLFYFVGHLLESTIIPLELAFEHRNYLPSIGLFLALSSTLFDFIKSKKKSSISLFFILLILFVLLNLRINFWSSEKDWINTNVAFRPTSERTQLNYLRYTAQNLGQEAVLINAQKAIALIPNKPSLALAYLMYGCTAVHESTHKDLIDKINHSLSTKNLTVLGINNLGILVKRVSKTGCVSISDSQTRLLIDNAVVHAQKMAHNNSGPHKVLGYLYYLHGTLSVSVGSTFEASKHFEHSYEYHNDYRYKIASIQALLTGNDTRQRGFEKLRLALDSISLRSNSNRKLLLEVSKKSENGNFGFNY